VEGDGSTAKLMTK